MHTVAETELDSLLLFRPWLQGHVHSGMPSTAARLLVVLPSCSPSLLRSWWLKANDGADGAGVGPDRLQRASWWVPTIVLNPQGWVALGMARSGGQQLGAWLDLSTSAHPLTANLGGGRMPIYTHAGLLHHATPHPEALVVASSLPAKRVGGGVTRETTARSRAAGAVLFGYDVGGLRRHRMVGFGIPSEGVNRLTPDGRAILSASVRWTMGVAEGSWQMPGLQEIFLRQSRDQAAMLLSLQPIMNSAGRTLLREYEAVARLSADDAERDQGAATGAPNSPCSHCRLWPSRPRFGGFSAVVDEQPEVTDSDIQSVLFAYAERALLHLSGGIERADVEEAARIQPTAWNARYQVIGGKAYIVSPPRLINHHHRKRLVGVRQILTDLLRAWPNQPDIDFVINFGDGPKLLPRPRPCRAAISARPPESLANGNPDGTEGHPTASTAAGSTVSTAAGSTVDGPSCSNSSPESSPRQSSPADATGFMELRWMESPPDCADFQYEELRTTPQGPFGPTSGSDNILWESGFANRSLPLFTATACCFAQDISFPTVWYDFSISDRMYSDLTAQAAKQKWGTKRERAYFRGSIYWFEGHGRTRAFAQSMAYPAEIDVDWYEKVNTGPLETDGENVLGDIGLHSRHATLVSHPILVSRTR